MGLLGLVIAGLGIGLTFYFGFTERYSLMEHGHRRRQSIGTMTGFTNEAAYWYIGGFLLIFAAYALGYIALMHYSRNADRSAWRWQLVVIILGGVAFSVILLPLYPVDASDIYDYIMRGRMSVLYDLNPMRDVPEDVSFDPFYRFASWRRTPSAYGPVWEMLAHGLTFVTHDLSRNVQVLAYKLLAVAGYALTALFIGLTLQRIAPRRLLIGLYIFMWNPLVIYMTAGTGHNDAVMTATIAFAIYAMSRHWYVAATVGASIGVLIKFVPVLLLPIIALVAFRELGLRRWLRYALISALLCGGMAILLYIPYWHGLDTVRASRRAVMYTGSVAAVARQWLMPYLDGISDISTSARLTTNTSAFLANSTIVVFGLFYVWQLLTIWREWRDGDLMPALRAFARIMTFYLVVVSLWFHAWYVLWLITIVALLEDTPTRRLALVFGYLVTWQAFLYNFLVVRPQGGMYLPWLDLAPVAIYMGYAWVYIAWYQLRQFFATANPLDRDIGAQLQQARESVGVSFGELSDELKIRYDHLVQYERGTRPINLRDGRLLAQRLGLSLPDWLGSKA